jgi:hypothetical protein
MNGPMAEEPQAPSAWAFAVGLSVLTLRARREGGAAPRPKPRLGRLPHGSTFHVVYAAEAVKWSGTLTIPAPGSGIFKESAVSADDGAVFALLQRLDRKFRGVEEEPPAATPAQPLS